jgi:hypothetical protein
LQVSAAQSVRADANQDIRLGVLVEINLSQGQQPQVPTQGQDPTAAALAKKELHAMKKRQLALDMEEMEMDGN